MVKVSELRAGQGRVDIEVVVKSKGEARTFNKYGKELRVANAVVADESGEISLSLWNQDIDKVKVGDKIKITNGYVSEFNGQKQLTSGKFGNMEVISSDSSSADAGDASGKAEEVKTEEQSATNGSESSPAKVKSRRETKKDKEEKEVQEEPSGEMSEEVAF
jgi:replication factor A1